MEVRDYYDLKYKKVIKLDEDFIVALPKSKMFLKYVNESEMDIIAAAAIIAYVREADFNNAISIKNDKNGKPFIKHDDKLYILIDELWGTKMDFSDDYNCTRFMEELAHFHNAAEGFKQPPGIKLKVLWGKRMEHYRMMASKLEKYSESIKDNDNLSEFEKCTKGYIDMLLKRAKASCKILRSIDYLMALEDSMKKKEVCINFISRNSAVINGDKVTFINLFNAGYNMVEEDISQVIKKCMEERPDKDLAENLLKIYTQIRQLDDRSEKIIKALSSYPSNSIKTIIKYTKNKDDEKMLLEKFNKYIIKEEKTDILGV